MHDPVPSDLLTNESNPFDRLPQEILAVILRHVAPSGTSFQHALVFKRWHRAACLAQSSVHVAKSRAISSPRLVLALSRFPRLTHLHIDRDGVDFLDDGFLTILAKGACNGCDSSEEEREHASYNEGEAKDPEEEEEESHEERLGAIGAGQRLELDGTASSRAGGTGDRVGGNDDTPHDIPCSSGSSSSVERIQRMTIPGYRAAAQRAIASALQTPHTQPHTSPLRALFLAEDPRSPARITAAGLDSLFLHCRLLHSLALHCGRAITALSPSIVTLPALTSLDIAMPCLGTEQSKGVGVGAVQELTEFAGFDNGDEPVGKSGGAWVQEAGKCAGRDCRDAEHARGGL
ncbi:unnamed protein product [Closterium sp. Naga37s-1]|nr:unnamed protein product [Closterium sp. Naga37s-1]